MSDTKSYELGGRTFQVPPVVAWQEKLLFPLLKPLYFSTTVEPEAVIQVIGDQLSRVAAILLVPVGQTQAQKRAAGSAGVAELEAWLESTTTFTDQMPVVRDFFRSGQPVQMLTGLAGIFVPLNSVTTGSTNSSPPSPMATPGEPTGSGAMSSLLMPSRSSSDNGSGEPQNAPSLVSAG